MESMDLFGPVAPRGPLQNGSSVEGEKALQREVNW